MRKRACAVCLENCLRLHGADEDDDEEDASPIGSSRAAKEEDNTVAQTPSFLKQMTEIAITSIMQLPSSFVKAHAKRLSMAVTLEGPSREKWKVEMDGALSKFSVSFSQGWKKFVADHVLQIGDQVSFTLTADSQFHVEVYDESGCQKTSALDATNSPTTPLETDSKDAEIGHLQRLKTIPAHRPSGRKEIKSIVTENSPVTQDTPTIQNTPARRGPGRPAKKIEKIESSSPVLVASEPMEKQDKSEKSKSSPVVKISGKRQGRSERIQSSPSPVKRLSGRNQKESMPHTAASPSTSKPIDIQSSGSESKSRDLPGDDNEVIETKEAENSPDRMLRVTDTVEGELLPEQILGGGHVISKRRTVTEAEKMQALQAAQALNLENPNTLVVMSKGYVYKSFWLNLNRQFGNEHMPKTTQNITLMNKAGFKWPVKWIKSGSQAGCSGGWRRFSLDHRLEEFDVCVFEVVDTKKFVILVHIFRVLGSGEDCGSYRPSEAEGRNEGKKRKEIELYCEDGENHHSKSTPVIGRPLKRRKRKRIYSDNMVSASCDVAEVPTSANSRQQENGKVLSISELERLTNSELSADIVLEDKSKYHSTCKKSIVPSASSHAENVLSAILPLAEATADEFGPMQLQVATTFTQNFIHTSRDIDLLKVAKELLTQKNSNPKVFPSAQVDGKLKCHVTPQTPTFSPDQVHEELAGTSLPVRHHASPLAASERKKNEGRLYKVVHLYKQRVVANQTEFLVDLDGASDGGNMANSLRDDDTGYWWVASNRFDWGMENCYIE